MKNIPVVLLCFCLMLCGCSVTQENVQLQSDPELEVRRFLSTHQLKLGLKSSEVKALIGHDVIIGYEMPDSRTKHYKPIVKSNPHRVENYKRGSKTYVIEYYLVGINNSDDKVSDDELTPLVFRDDELLGWGWDYLKRIKAAGN